jgi:hypothetical protein
MKIFFPIVIVLVTALGVRVAITMSQGAWELIIILLLIAIALYFVIKAFVGYLKMEYGVKKKRDKLDKELKEKEIIEFYKLYEYQQLIKELSDSELLNYLGTFDDKKHSSTVNFCKEECKREIKRRGL